MYGILPGEKQTPGRAKLYSICMLLAWVLGDLTVVGDCKDDVRGFALGKEHCLRYKRNSDL